jgi:hypothetical protein
MLARPPFRKRQFLKFCVRIMRCFGSRTPDLARTGRFACPTGKSATGLSSPARKNILVFFRPKSHAYVTYPAPMKGAYRDRHGRWMRDAMDVCCALTNAQACGRPRRVVLMPRRWHQACGGYSTGDGGKKARSPGRVRNKPLTPSRGECRTFPA